MKWPAHKEQQYSFICAYMDLTNELQIALTSQLNSISHEQLIDAAIAISSRYRGRENLFGKHFIQNRNEALAYTVARMPATFGAVSAALKYALSCTPSLPLDISSLIDIGAGTGAATLAANEQINLHSIICVEYDTFMKDLGKALMSQSASLKKTEWKSLNIAIDDLPWQADMVIASYVMNELEEDVQEEIAEKLWLSTKKVLLFVEAGTPAGYRVINRIRSRLLEYDAHILAPCPHENECPITQDDWCHFTCRIQRNRLHRLAKGGESPFEDEKFSYLAVSKQKVDSNFVRILRHPQIGKGHIKLELCTKDGLKQITYSKRNGDIYKIAKKADCGDKIE